MNDARRPGNARASGEPGPEHGDAGPEHDDAVHDDAGLEQHEQGPELVRLQKVLSAAGVASRRKAEALIRAGRVRVDGVTVREMGVRIDPDRAVVHVDGSRIVLRSDQIYLALNKMPGVLSTMSDDEGRPCIGDLLEEWGFETRLFHVGRLDIDSEGLLLLTNDGELAHRLTHPSFGVPKTYMAEIPGPVPRDLARRLLRGVELDDGIAKVDSFDVVDVLGGRAVVKLVLHEGRKRLVRRMLAALDHPVSRLVRTEIGGVQLGHQRPGTVRKLGPVEISLLYKAAGM